MEASPVRDSTLPPHPEILLPGPGCPPGPQPPLQPVPAVLLGVCCIPNPRPWVPTAAPAGEEERVAALATTEARCGAAARLLAQLRGQAAAAKRLLPPGDWLVGEVEEEDEEQMGGTALRGQLTAGLGSAGACRSLGFDSSDLGGGSSMGGQRGLLASGLGDSTYSSYVDASSLAASALVPQAAAAAVVGGPAGPAAATVSALAGLSAGMGGTDNPGLAAAEEMREEREEEVVVQGAEEFSPDASLPSDLLFSEPSLPSEKVSEEEEQEEQGETFAGGPGTLAALDSALGGQPQHQLAPGELAPEPAELAVVPIEQEGSGGSPATRDALAAAAAGEGGVDGGADGSEDWTMVVEGEEGAEEGEGGPAASPGI